MVPCSSASTRLVVNTSSRARRSRTSSSGGSSHPPLNPPAQKMAQIIMLPQTSFANCVRRASTYQHSKELFNAPKESFRRTSFEDIKGNGRLYQKQMLLASGIFAFSFGYMTSKSTVDPGGSGSGLGSKFSGGGGGNGKPTSSFSILSTRENAEEDVRKLRAQATQRPYMISAGAVQGARWTMEDEYIVANGGRFAAVFDGHGGNLVSRFLKKRLYDEYSKILSSKHWEFRDDFADRNKLRTPSVSSHVASIRSAFEKIEQEVLEDDDMGHQGSTAVAVVVHVAEDGHRTLLSANVGDSRAILSKRKKAIDLTWDHKPNEERERARIFARGGEVEWDPHAQVHRVQHLSLSRAIGDRFAKPIVTADPEIRVFPVADGDDEFFLLASDGLWDVMTSQDVVDFVHSTLENENSNKQLRGDEKAIKMRVLYKKMAKLVAEEALARGSSDNICVLLVWLDESLR